MLDAILGEFIMAAETADFTGGDYKDRAVDMQRALVHALDHAGVESKQQETLLHDMPEALMAPRAFHNWLDLQEVKLRPVFLDEPEPDHLSDEFWGEEAYTA